MNKTKLSTVPTEDLQRVFETAVGELQQVECAGKRPGYRTAIFQRAAKGALSSARSEKRAVGDAACALAQLWKISPHPAR